MESFWEFSAFEALKSENRKNSANDLDFKSEIIYFLYLRILEGNSY